MPHSRSSSKGALIPIDDTGTERFVDEVVIAPVTYRLYKRRFAGLFGLVYSLPVTRWMCSLLLMTLSLVHAQLRQCDELALVWPYSNEQYAPFT